MSRKVTTPHKWAFAFWATVIHFARTERCKKCGTVRKLVKRSWRHAWPDGWHGLRPDCEAAEVPDDRQLALFTPTPGEVTT